MSLRARVKPGKNSTTGQPFAGLAQGGVPHQGEPAFGTPSSSGTVTSATFFGSGLNRVISKLVPVASIGEGFALSQFTVSGPTGLAAVGGAR